MNALDMLDEQYVTVDTVDDIIEDLEEDAMMASAEHDWTDYYGVQDMEVFQGIGILVSALLIYAVFTLFILCIIARLDEEDTWQPIAWFSGGVIFAVVSYCWITGVPFPQF